MDRPKVIEHDSFQQAWSEAVKLLAANGWERSNVIVQIGKPESLDETFDALVRRFAEEVGVLSPKQVAYTIFPHRLYAKKKSSSALFTAYNRERGLFDRIKTRWGTYFRRMTQYEGRKGVENQLDRIIAAINTRKDLYRAAYTILIQHPGGETVQPLGGPCLNYAAVQLAAGDPPRLGLLAVYRNHDFLERAYGNYWGLCNLIRFLAKETASQPGPLTCVSSHAYVDKKKRALRAFVEGL